MSKPIAFDLLPYESDEMMVGEFRLRYIDVGPYGVGSNRPGDETGGLNREAVQTEREGAGSQPPSSGSNHQMPNERVILCVHGNPTWSFYWRRVIERFANEFRVVAVDHIGCGRSEKPPRDRFDYTLAAHRDNLIALIDHLNLGKITLLAHDWGGAIGLSSVLERLDCLEQIVLLNTGAYPPPFVPLRIAACRIPLLGTWAVRRLNLFARAAVSMAMSRQKMPSEVARGLLAPYDTWDHRVAIDAFVRDIPMTTRHPTYQTLRNLELRLPELARFPSLLVWGMKDWCFRPECLTRFQQVWPGAESVEIADAGHYVMEDAAEEVLASIADFLNRSTQRDHSNPRVPNQLSEPANSSAQDQQSKMVHERGNNA